MSNQCPSCFQILIQNIWFPPLIVHHGAGLPIVMTTPGHVSMITPVIISEVLLSDYGSLLVPPLHFLPPTLLAPGSHSNWKNRKVLSNATCQLSPCFPSLLPWNHGDEFCLVLALWFTSLGFFFPPFLSFLCRLTLALVDSILSPFVSPKSLLHQLFPLFLKSSITLSLHWLLPPLATNILRSPSF